VPPAGSLTLAVDFDTGPLAGLLHAETPLEIGAVPR
jgi:hypothetical protein